MKTRKSQLLRRRNLYLGLSYERSPCRQCLALQRRQNVGSSIPQTEAPTKLQVVSAMYAYLMTSWEELPEQSKRALGFDSVVGGEEEEAALNRLAGLFMEYADVSLRRALEARRRRLGPVGSTA
ncbi:hypothetical protein GIV53_02890 [Pseudomonas syringae]|uniref:Uncharacterized protein n=1 Tax=Pseudomonas syringae TaxID=317 RepID=A0A9Q4A1B6_PSESX|nr:hypothetical protein [Pseudomonas syringae]MCF5628274.1 hypothetical protein [Pseudomonas syringae]